MPSRCQIRQYSDTTTCSYCGLSWDTNDSNPPKCGEFSLQKRSEFAPVRPPATVKKNVKANITSEQWEALKEAIRTGDAKKLP